MTTFDKSIFLETFKVVNREGFEIGAVWFSYEDDEWFAEANAGADSSDLRAIADKLDELNNAINKP